MLPPSHVFPDHPGGAVPPSPQPLRKFGISGFWFKNPGGLPVQPPGVPSPFGEALGARPLPPPPPPGLATAAPAASSVAAANATIIVPFVMVESPIG